MLGKHVIFLGAGASMSSGYPSAERLRIILGDESAFRDHVREHNPDCSSYELDALVQLRNESGEALNYFRYGCFGSIDEFCKLAGGRLPDHVQKLKKMVRVVLGAVNPEAGYTKSDYYPFIQRLFKMDSAELRKDIVLLSYNYDPYLPYLLARAHFQRRKVYEGAEIQDPKIYNDLTSGFGSGGDSAWAAREGFQFLALHGLISYPSPPSQGGRNPGSIPDLAFHQILQPREEARVTALARTFLYSPPLIFPWELLDDSGNHQSAEKYEVWDQCMPTYPGSDFKVSVCFNQIWQKARNAVQTASKISFVGIAMHSYLHGGLRYLFSGKSGNPDILSVSRQNVGNDGELGPEFLPLTPAGKLRRLLRETCPDLKPPVERSRTVVHYDGGTTVRTTTEFRTFIDREL